MSVRSDFHLGFYVIGTQVTNHSGEKNREKVLVEVRNSSCQCALHLKMEAECVPITLNVSSKESVAFRMQASNFDRDHFYWCIPMLLILQSLVLAPISPCTGLLHTRGSHSVWQI